MLKRLRSKILLTPSEVFQIDGVLNAGLIRLMLPVPSSALSVTLSLSCWFGFRPSTLLRYEPSGQMPKPPANCD